MAEQDAAHVRPALWMTALIVAAWIAGTIWSGGSMMPPGAPLPPSLLLLLPLSSAVALLVGFRAANLAFVVCLAVFAIYWRARPAMGPLETTAHVNFLLALLTLQIFVWGFHVTFRRLNRLLGAQQRIIALRLEEHARLVNTLVSDIKSCLTAMRPHFDASRLIAPKALRAEQSSLTEILRKAQASLVPAHNATLPKPHLDFRSRMLTWILSITAVETALLALRGFLGAQAPYLPATLLMISCGVLLAIFALRPAWRSALALVFALASLTTIVVTMFFWGFSIPPPGTLFVITIAYHAILIDRPLSGLAVVCMNLAVVAFVASQGAARTLGGSVFLFYVALCAIAMQVYWHLMDRLILSSLRASQRRGQDLSHVELFRTRICGTLFHDVANLAQGMEMMVAFDDATSSEDARQFERLHTRLSKLVVAATETMAEEGPMLAERLAPVALHEVFREAQELFAFRLQQKSQSLECSLTEPLAVTAQPDLLRDSVIANLLSNAIKFSPRGAAIQLKARRDRETVEISVRDHGPGFPSGLVERLTNGDKVFSTEGTTGETGLGLGLTLTREHVLRMGGSIAFRRMPGGGSEAVISLRPG